MEVIDDDGVLVFEAVAVDDGAAELLVDMVGDEFDEIDGVGV